MQQPLFPLDGPRLASLIGRTTRVPRTHTLHPPARADAKAYWRAAQYRQGDTPDGWNLRKQRAARGLWRALIQKVEGYQLPGGSDVMVREDWKDVVPDGDALVAAGCLLTVQLSAQPAEEVEPGVDFALLDALMFSGTPGSMIWRTGLLHRLRRMTEQDRLDMQDELTREIPVQGSRSGQTIAPLREAVLASFYDRLVVSVEGYAVAGQPLADVEEIRRWMDPFHKVAAMDAASAPTSDVEIAEPERSAEKGKQPEPEESNA